MIRKHPNLYADVSALHTRPLQMYLALAGAVEYRVIDKLLFGTDFPFATPTETADALLNVNDLVRGSNLPPIPEDAIEDIIQRDTTVVLGLDSAEERR